MSSEKDLNEEYRAVIECLDQFYREVNLQIGDLDKALQQIDKYQQDIQTLKQKLVQEEQLLKSMTPEHPADNVQVRVCFLFPSTLLFFLKLFSHHQKNHKNLKQFSVLEDEKTNHFVKINLFYLSLLFFHSS